MRNLCEIYSSSSLHHHNHQPTPRPRRSTTINRSRKLCMHPYIYIYILHTHTTHIRDATEDIQPRTSMSASLCFPTPSPHLASHANTLVNEKSLTSSPESADYTDSPSASSAQSASSQSTHLHHTHTYTSRGSQRATSRCHNFLSLSLISAFVYIRNS